jgi:hypothetical protein
MQWNPVLAGMQVGPGENRFVRSPQPWTPLPKDDDAIAYAPVSQLSRWIEQRQLSSARLTEIYLSRLERFDRQLRCVITLTGERALRQARKADAEIAAGHYRGPLHGIPWGAKDLLDTAGIPTTYGAEFYHDRIPQKDAVVVSRLDEAGAVLVAKLSLGALALNDIWFGGQTMNPWLLEEGASGSSAGPGAATAAGLVAFSIGSETGGSIVSPSMRLRRHRSEADLWTRAADRRHDAVLIAGQAGTDDARSRRRAAGVEGHFGSRCGRFRKCSEHIGL